ncbi:hypothetical protein [Actinoplanes sp. NPDC051851]|uniref:hypothetical protein n=1 Tax=Actinoplanes sp. NPDC051851 TaxID=3154753 RepID=UPI00342C95CE
MADWILVPCLVTLRTEFNRLAPDRDHASDGSIGDAAHASSSSDHNPDETGATPYEDADAKNEVHAIDVDSDLRRSGWTMKRAVDVIVGRHRAGKDDRLQNVIYNRKIASRSWGWTWRDYDGSSPHTEHAHFSARYTTAQESDTSPWGLLEEDDDMDQATFTKYLENALKDGDVRRLMTQATLGTDGVIASPSTANSKNADGTPNAEWAGGSFLQNIYNMLYTTRAYAATAAGKDFDEQEVIAGILAGLDPNLIAAAIPQDSAERVAQALAERLSA